MSRITVRRGEQVYSLSAGPEETLLEVLRRAELAPEAPCGGKGKCGKCRVWLVEPEGGRWAAACRTYGDSDREVLLSPEETGGHICESGEVHPEPGGNGWGAAVDVGTTSVVLRLYDRQTGCLIAARRAWNAQRPYGADVVTRMQYAMEREKGMECLSGQIRSQVLSMLDSACGEAGIAPEAVGVLFVAGNTVMEHFFAGISPRKIALAPYEPGEYFDDGVAREIPERPGLSVYYAPCVSGYVGGDVIAGLLAAGVWEKRERSLYLDIGTNGEMALSAEGEILACSVACGPAFEGAEVSCGMGSFPGAVCRADWENGALRLEVFGGGAPRGLCGSGLLDVLALLVRSGVVDESGCLLPPGEAPAAFERYLGRDEDGNGIFYLTEARDVCLTAADVRKLQLAKSAVAAGISVLLREAGLKPADVDGLYIAGGFGNALRPESAAAVGMIPAVLKGRTYPCGNAALAGAAMALCSGECREELRRIRSASRYLELAGNRDFGEKFVEHMTFEDEEDIIWSCISL